MWLRSPCRCRRSFLPDLALCRIAARDRGADDRPRLNLELAAGNGHVARRQSLLDNGTPIDGVTDLDLVQNGLVVRADGISVEAVGRVLDGFVRGHRGVLQG